MGELLEQCLLLRKHLLTKALEAFDDMPQRVLGAFQHAAVLLLLLVHRADLEKSAGSHLSGSTEVPSQ
ncbi:hypothetical protein D3C85_1721070 [compost metagenome]